MRYWNMTSFSKKEDAVEQAEQLMEYLRPFGPEVLGILRQLLAKEFPKPTGRPQEPDHAFLIQMAEIRNRGEGHSIREAAHMVLESAPGGATSTNVERLRKKYGQNSRELEDQVRARDEARANCSRPVYERYELTEQERSDLAWGAGMR